MPQPFMREHIIIKMKQPAQEDFYSWQHFINDKSSEKFSLDQDVDSILSKNEIPVWVTHEYEKASKNNWSANEVKHGLNRIYRLILKEKKGVPQNLVDQISLLPQVDYVKKMEVTTTELPNYEAKSLSSISTNRKRNELTLRDAHRFSQGDSSIKIAVLDTGISLTHPELQHALIEGQDFVNIIDGQSQFVGDYLGFDTTPEDEVGHGTHVTGIISARGKNMSIGLAPKCQIVPVRVLGALKRGDSVVGAGIVENINAGLKYAVDQKVDIINMSLGIKNQSGGLPHKEVVDYAHDEGVTIVAAAGNDGRQEMYYPGANPYVIAVGAVDTEGQIAPFSTYGAHISFVAPGTNVYSTFLKDRYAYSSGTSQAAPYVTGLIALLKSYSKKRGKNISDAGIKKLLMLTADRQDRRLKNIKSGYGAVNVLDALKLLDYKLNRFKL